MIIPQQSKLAVIFLMLIAVYLITDVYVVSKFAQENRELMEVIEMNLRVNQDISMQLNSCVDMLKVYQVKDSYGNPN